MQSSVLVTGGAGYIGSHVVKQLGAQLGLDAKSLIVLDDLSTGFKPAVKYGTFVQGSVDDYDLVLDLLKQHNVKTVLHFAAKTIVPESVSNPLKYFRCNTFATTQLMQACVDAGVENFIFSSTAAVYGIPETDECTEETPTNPINAYGASKLMSEQILKEVGRAHGMKFVVLRYFNVAGCDPEGKIGQSTKKATLLTKVAVEAALGKREKVYVFGTDYDTPDGTGIRDYIHVEDLASAHLCAMKYLENGGESITLNCGYGHGYSVREVLAMVEQVHGEPLNIEEQGRRAGDPPALVAKSAKVNQILNWTPQYDDLSVIVSSALAWEKKLMACDQDYPET